MFLSPPPEVDLAGGFLLIARKNTDSHDDIPSEPMKDPTQQ
jgi:hypothetical protein